MWLYGRNRCLIRVTYSRSWGSPVQVHRMAVSTQLPDVTLPFAKNNPFSVVSSSGISHKIWESSKTADALARRTMTAMRAQPIWIPVLKVYISQLKLKNPFVTRFRLNISQWLVNFILQHFNQQLIGRVTTRHKMMGRSSVSRPPNLVKTFEVSDLRTWTDSGQKGLLVSYLRNTSRPQVFENELDWLARLLLPCVAFVGEWMRIVWRSLRATLRIIYQSNQFADNCKTKLTVDVMMAYLKRRNLLNYVRLSITSVRSWGSTWHFRSWNSSWVWKMTVSKQFREGNGMPYGGNEYSQYFYSCSIM